MNCIDRLGEGLSRLCHRTVPSSYRYDEAKRLRVITNPASFGSVVDAAFNPIRQYGAASPAVLIRLLETLAIVANHVIRDEDQCALEKHATLIQQASSRSVPDADDRKDVEERFAAVQIALRKLAPQEG